jgi:hypothetical protein
MSAPERSCSAPSSSMMAVPDAPLLPMRPRPAARASGSVIRAGNPRGNVSNGTSVTSPAISQCPVMVSLPADASTMLPYAPSGAATAGTPAICVTCPNPSAPRFGNASPPIALARFPSVSAAASPYSAASGAPPHPTPSATKMTTRRCAEEPMERS